MADGDEIELDLGLSLVPRYEVQFTFYRKEVAPPVIDEWQLKQTLIEAMKRLAKFVLANDRDLKVRKEANLQRKRREDPVATGTLTLLGVAELAGATSALIKQKLDGYELRVAGVKLICKADIGSTVSYVSMEEEWVQEYGKSTSGYKSRRPGDRPDTCRIKGIPPRWLADPKVSPNPSVLVTHSLFSGFGAVRKLEILGNADVSKAAREGGGGGPTGEGFAARLQCEVVVQYEDHSSFCKALRAFAARAMKKVGSSLVATYSVEWDKTDFFNEKNVRQRRFEKDREEEDEKRRLGMLARRAELARLEQERREAEEREQVLREEEERLREEEEEAKRVEEERIRLEEELRLKEEERVREEEERVAREAWEEEQQQQIREEEERARREEEEARRKEEEERRREEDEKRLKEEMELKLREEIKRVQARRREVEEEGQRRERERRLRAEVEDRMRDRRGDRYGDRRREPDDRSRGRYGDRGGREDESEDDRWRLDGTQSAASLDSLAELKQAALEMGRIWSREKDKEADVAVEGDKNSEGERGVEEEGGEGEKEMGRGMARSLEDDEEEEGVTKVKDSWGFSSKRLRSMVVSEA